MFTIGAFAVILDSQDRVLLCHRRDVDAWDLPGGGVESGELPTEAAVREVMEETGLEVAIDRFVGVYGKVDENELVFVFTCRRTGGQLTATDETSECRYFSVQDLPINTCPKHVERIHDALSSLNQTVIRRQTSPSTREMLRQLRERNVA